MDRYTFFTLEDDSRYAMPVIRAYPGESPLVARFRSSSFETVRQFLQRELRGQLASTNPAIQNAAASILEQFEGLYSMPTAAPSEYLNAARSSIRSMLEKYKMSARPAVLLSKTLSVEVGAHENQGRVDVHLQPTGGVSLAFLDSDVVTLQDILREAGFLGPFTVYAPCACSLSMQIPADELPSIPPEFATRWLNSRTK